MWLQIGGLVVGLLSVAASANWLARSRVRRVTTIRHEAELLAVLPEGEARDELAQRVERDVRRHVKMLEHPDIFRMIALVKLALWVSTGFAVIGVGGLIVLLATDSDVEWLRVVGWTAVGAELIVLAGGVVLMKVVERRWERPFRRDALGLVGLAGEAWRTARPWLRLVIWGAIFTQARSVQGVQQDLRHIAGKRSQRVAAYSCDPQQPNDLPDSSVQCHQVETPPW